MKLRPRAGRVVFLASLVLFASAGTFRSGAYIFSHARPSDGPFLYNDGQESKERWQAHVWGPGTTAVVAVPDDPRWLEAEGVASMEEARALVDRALAEWREIATADIRWEARPATEEDDTPITVSIRPLANRIAQAFLSSNDSPGEYGVDSCEVSLDDDTLSVAPDLLYSLLVHELGHCLSLDHGGRYPNARFWHGQDGLLWNPLWGRDGPMAAWGPPVVVSFDEAIGASLLRPRPGWLETTGALYGSVIGEGALPALLRVNVLAARVAADGSLRGAVQAPTNKFGHFTIEGLDPGLYVLMVYSMGRPDPWTERNEDFRDTLRLSPVEVRAGERTGPVVLTVRPREVP